MASRLDQRSHCTAKPVIIDYWENGDTYMQLTGAPSGSILLQAHLRRVCCVRLPPKRRVVALLNTFTPAELTRYVYFKRRLLLFIIIITCYFVKQLLPSIRK